MKHVFRVVLTWVVLTGLVVAQTPSVEAQNQSPTTSSNSSNIRRLREQLQESLGRMRSERDGEETQQQEGQGEQAQGEQPQAEGGEAQPAGARRGRSASKPISVRGTLPGVSIKSSSSGKRATGGGGAEAVRTIGKGAYEPLKNKKIEYRDLPDEGELMTLTGPIPVGEFLETLSFATGWNILVTEEARNVNLQFWIADTKPSVALKEIFPFHDLYYSFRPETNCLYVMTKDEHLAKTYGDLQEYEIVAEHASVDYLESMVASLLSPEGRIVTDPRTNRIYIWDAEDNLIKMKETVEQLDVPLDERTFTITHTDVADVEPIIGDLLSPSGQLVVDPRTGQVMIKDLPSNIEQVEKAIAKLDVPMESRTFEVKYIDAENLLDSLEPLLSERGILQVDPHLNTVIVTDLPARQDQMAELITTLDKKLETRTWVIDYLEPDDVADRIETLVPEEMGDIVVDEMVHQVTVTALPERLDEIDALIETWDIKRRQVQIEAYLVGVSGDVVREFNVDWNYFTMAGSTPMAYRVGAGAKPDYSSLEHTMTVGQLPFTESVRSWLTGETRVNLSEQEVIDEFKGNRLAAVINYLDTTNKGRVLASPRIVVQDGEEAVFQAGRQVPYVTSTTYGSGYSSSYYNRYNNTNTTDGTNSNYYNYGSYRPYNRIDFMEVGTILRVLPRITDEGSILLDISAEDSDASEKTITANGEENTIPEKSENVAETQVRAHDGQTIVIGGLRKNRSERAISRAVPILSDIPIIGRAFRSPSKKVTDDTLMIFICPTVVDEYTHPEAVKLAEVENGLAEASRKENKSTFGRALDKLSRGKNELGVSIGQSGSMHSEGATVTLDTLRERFASAKNGVTVVLRRHPRAPEDVVDAVVAAAEEAGLKVEFDGGNAPFVPDYSSRPEGEGGEAGDEETSADMAEGESSGAAEAGSADTSEAESAEVTEAKSEDSEDAAALEPVEKK